MGKKLLAGTLGVLLLAAPMHSIMGLSATMEKQGMQNEAMATSDNSDLFLKQQINKSLENDTQFSKDFRNIDISASNGIVTLKGTVADESTKQALEKKIAALPGVKQVKDDELKIEK